MLLLLWMACSGSGKPVVPDVVLEQVDAQCGQAEEESLKAEMQGEVLRVRHEHFAEGCCPQVTGDAWSLAHTLTVTVDLTQDFCECICWLDVEWQVSGVLAGGWSVVSEGLKTTVQVP